jgi:hypothetical protein
MVGTMDQQDQQAMDAAKPVYTWLARNQEYFAGQQSAARVLLLGRPPGAGRGYGQNSYRGLFRLLTEHISVCRLRQPEMAGTPNEFDR